MLIDVTTIYLILIIQIKVSWEGDFYGANTYTNLLHKYVLIPEWQRVREPHRHEQIMVCSVSKCILLISQVLCLFD